MLNTDDFQRVIQEVLTKERSKGRYSYKEDNNSSNNLLETIEYLKATIRILKNSSYEISTESVLLSLEYILNKLRELK